MVHEGTYTCILEDKVTGQPLAEASVPVTVTRKYIVNHIFTCWIWSLFCFPHLAKISLQIFYTKFMNHNALLF